MIAEVEFLKARRLLEGMLVVVILVPPFRTQQAVASTFWISLVLDADIHFLFKVYLILSSFFFASYILLVFNCSLRSEGV